MRKQVKFCALSFLLCAFFGCKKSDSFYEKLSSIPQINNVAQYQYRPAYGVGDTLTITGFLYPKNGLKITIGGVDAPIVMLDSIPHEGTGWQDQASVIITKAMGIGDNRSVNVTSSGYTTPGASIQIYDVGGQGSLAQPLKLSLLYTAPSRQNIYLNCVNGKGDIYYYGFSDGNLYHLKKDGLQETLLSATQLTTDQTGAFGIGSFIAGGVNPQGTMAWISLQDNTGSYRFCQVDISAKTVRTLNRSTAIATPYEGAIVGVKAILSGIFADGNGKVYGYVGLPVPATYNVTSDNAAQAVASYDSASGQFKYLFKTKTAAADMPGIALDLSGYQGINLRLNPADGVLYAISQKAVSYNGQLSYVTGMDEYQLNTGTKTGSFIPQNGTAGPLTYLGPMQYLQMLLVVSPQNALDAGVNFGMMPLPNRRTLFLFDQQSTGNSNLPKWIAVDFAGKKLYQWAPGSCDLNGYNFSPVGSSSTSRVDQLLNYDEDGQLYMTASSRAAIVKTTFR